MLIRFDPGANAVYLTVKESASRGGETEVTENGMIVDRGAEGDVRGYEWLSVRQHGLSTLGLPAEVASFINEFVDSGALLSDSCVERREP